MVLRNFLVLSLVLFTTTVCVSPEFFAQLSSTTLKHSMNERFVSSADENVGSVLAAAKLAHEFGHIMKISDSGWR